MVSVYCGTQGVLDDLPVEQVKPFEAALLTAFRTRHADLLGHVRDTGDLPDDEKLRRAIDDVKLAFLDEHGPEAGASRLPAADDSESLPSSTPSRGLARPVREDPGNRVIQHTCRGAANGATESAASSARANGPEGGGGYPVADGESA